MTKIKGADSLFYKEALEIIKRLPCSHNLIPVGSVASKQPKVNDLDFITTKNLEPVSRCFINYFPKTWRNMSLGEKRFDYYPIINDKKIVVNIWYSDKKDLSTFYFAYAYPRGFVIAMRKRAGQMGFKLNQYGMYLDDKKIDIKDINQIFEILDLDFRTPEQEYKKHIKKY